MGRRVIRIIQRLTCTLRGHDWRRGRINQVSRRDGKTCRRCGRRVVWQWDEGTVVWEAPWFAEREGRPRDVLPSAKAESVERWRQAEQAAGRETR